MRSLKLMILAAALVMVPSAGFASAKNGLSYLENAVRKELVMLPFLTVFDNLEYQVENGNVILSGQVTRPTLKSSAENVVKRLEGVASVDNRIEVLPLSPYDNRIRFAVARAVFGFGPLNRYALGANPPIRIVVKNGNVTLEGVVGNEGDRTLAFMRANGVSGVFSVKNDLKVSQS